MIDDIARGAQLELASDHAGAIAALEPAVAAAREAGNARAEVEALVWLGVAQRASGADATATLAAAVARAEALGDPAWLARASWESADRERAVAEWESVGQLGWALRARAALAVIAGNNTGARDLYVTAVAMLPADGMLVEVLQELARAQDAAGDGDAAHAARMRAIDVARDATGAGSQRTQDCVYWAGLVRLEPTIARLDEIIAGADDLAAANLLYTRGSVLVATDAPGAWRAREASLIRRETALGIADHSLIPMRKEIADAWHALGRSDEAEAFLQRCRDRTMPPSWLYRNLTYDLGYLLQGAQRRDEYAALWRAFLAAREASCAAGSDEVFEALEIVADKLAYYAPQDEVLALAQRAVDTRESLPGLGALAQAYKVATRIDDARRVWRRAVERWLSDGATAREPAIEAFAEDVLPEWSMEPPKELLASLVMLDDVVARAEPKATNLAWLYALRGRIASQRKQRPEQAAADLERALALYETAEGPHGEGVCFTCYTLSEHFLQRDEIEAGLKWLRKTIEVRQAADIFEHHYDQDRLAERLEQRNAAGDLAEAIAIRTKLVDAWQAGAPTMVLTELENLVRAQLRVPDLDAARATCERASKAAEAAGVNERRTAPDVWWHYIRALDDTRAIEAIDRMMELWRLPGATGTIDANMRGESLPEAAATHLRDRVLAASRDGADESRALEDQLLGDRSQPDAYLVLADALTGRGDPRGELITIQHALVAKPDDSELTTKQDDILFQHRTRLLGALEPASVKWQLGYFRTAEVSAELLADTLAHPSARFLAELDIKSYDDPSAVLLANARELRRVAIVRVASEGVSDDAKAGLCGEIPTLQFT